jgi:cytochrome P450
MTVTTAPGRIPLVGHALPLARKRMEYLQQLRLLDDVVEVFVGTQPYYLLNAPEVIHQVLTVQGDKFDKGKLFENLRPFLGNGVLTCPKAEHRQQRRMLQPAFHHSAIDRYTEFMARSAATQTSGYRDGQVIDVSHEMRRLTVIIMCKVIFAADDVDEVAEEIHRALPELLKGVIRRTVMPAEFLNRIPTPANRRYERAAAQIRRAVLRATEVYRRAGVDRGDVISLLLAVRDADGNGLTDDQIVDQVVTFLMAGSESTASAMCWFFHAMTQTPDVQTAICAEIDEVIGSRTPTMADIARLTQFNHALLETMRLYHPVWFLTRRSVAPVTVSGREFPAGANFIYSLASLHRDPYIFTDPLAFRPGRWAEAAPDRHSFIPFGAGTRKCIGDDFAMIEMSVILVTILQQWHLRLTDDRAVKPVAMAVMHPDRLVLRLAQRHREPSSRADQTTVSTA